MSVICLSLPPDPRNWFDDLDAGFRAIPGASVVRPGPAPTLEALESGIADCRDSILRQVDCECVVLPCPVVGDALAMLRARAARGHPRMIVSYWHGPTRIAAGHALRAPANRCAMWFRWADQQLAMLPAVLAQLDGVLCATEDGVATLRGLGVAPERARAVGFPVRAVEHVDHDRKRAPGGRVAFPHRLALNRGVDILESVVEALPEFRFVVARPEDEDVGVSVDTLSAVVERLVQHPRVEFVVSRSKDELWTVLAGCDVVLSLARKESFGVSIVEAMACGLVPVLPRLPAYVELVQEEAFLYDGRDELVERLRGVMRDLPRLSAFARSLVRRHAPDAFGLRVAAAIDSFRSAVS